MKLKKIIRFGIAAMLLLIVLILGTNIWVIQSTRAQIYEATDVPLNDVALVLGTSKKTSSGGENRFFVERMNMAALLHQQNKIKHILVSGDNRTKYYNEPRDMLNALGDLNIPDSVVSLDYAGFRTLDSVVRSKEVFGQDAVTIVTQKFHCYRALFIANYLGTNAFAVSADDGGPVGANLAIREVIARTVAVLDLYVLQRKPKFLGERVKLNF